VTPLVLVAGPPGAGKSTVGRLLAQTWDRAVHVHTDDLYAWIASGYIEPWLAESHEQNVTIARTGARAADALADGGYTVVVDGVLSPWALDPYLELEREIAYVVLRPTLEVAQRRAADRGEHRLKDLSVVGQMHSVFSEALLGDLERHVVDSTIQTPEETATEIRARLDRGDLTLTRPPTSGA
jgi:adenylate kinase family enzyme